MPADRSNRDPMWYVLEDMQEDVRLLSAKFETQLVETTKIGAGVGQLSSKVNDLSHILLKDNGKPSIVSQLSVLNSEVKDLKSILEVIQKQVGVKTPEELRIERWKTLGKVAAAATAVVPGLLAFIHTFM